MEVIFVLLPLAVMLAAAALIAFVRAASAGQFDDLDTPPHRILHDDDDEVPPRDKAVEPAKTAAGSLKA